MLQLNLRIKIRKLIQLALTLLLFRQGPILLLRLLLLLLYTLQTSIGWHFLSFGSGDAILLHHCIIISSNLEIGRALFFVH